MRKRSGWHLGVQPMLRALTSVESTALDIAPSLSAPRTYRRLGRIFVAESTMPSIFRKFRYGSFLEPILRATGVCPWRLQALFPFLPRVEITSAADVILVSANLRAFYASRKITLKLANPTRKGSVERLAREVSVRTGLVPGIGVRVPELSPAPINPEAGFVVEELLDARPVDPREIPAEKISKCLLAFFAANRLEMKPLGDVVCFSREWQALAAYCENSAIAIPPEVQQAVATALSDTSLAAQLVPCAMCHFDLSVSNLMHSDDMLFIIDWEWGEYSMIFVDTIRLSTQIPEFATCFIEQFDSLVPTDCPAMLDTETQLLVAAIHAGLKRVARRAEYAGEGEAPKDERKMKRRITQILDVYARRQRRG